MHLLDNVKLWLFFRRIMDTIFGLYSKRFKIIKSFNIIEKASVLDIGCGTGEYAQLTSGRYEGLDIDKGYINAAKKIFKNSPNKNFICQDLNETNYNDNEFEISIMVDLTHHISDVEIEKLFTVLNRVTQKFIIICDPIKQSRTNYIGRFLASQDRGKYIRPENQLLEIVNRYFKISRVEATRLIGIEGICILAEPKK